MGDAQGLDDGSMTSSCMSLMSVWTSSCLTNGSRRGCCLIGECSPVSIRCRVGPKHQADIPNLIPAGLRLKDENEEDGLIWSPCSTIEDKILVEYVDETREKLEYSREQSLGILFWNAYDLEKTREEVMKYRPNLDNWSREDKALFEECFQLYGKNFGMIRKMLPNKPMKSMIEYY
ncbi:REST corepressor [Trichonephila clavata]|uniref:REST corepressor n=1 Tax=Trichonephila clavata TaxID=2740835 RepID=A0A8X6F5U1_TRICU|nr:REST corepressor [Trichonephila clavata]